MKNNAGSKFATNKGGVIKSPKPKDEPKSTTVKGGDLRNGNGKKK